MSDIAIGLIGTGGMGTRHAMNLHQHVVGARVAGVYDLDAGRAALVAADCDNAMVFADPQALIESAQIEAVVIASPDATHAQFALACLQAGKPVLCEKPLALSSQEALRVVEAERALGKRLLALGFMRRFDPQHVGVQLAIPANDLGRPILFKGSSRNPNIPYGMSAEMILLNSVIHDFDAMRWLMGQEVESAYMQAVSSQRSAQPNAQDLFLIHLSLSGGCLATIEAYMRADYGYDISAEVVCERGAAETLDPDVVRTRRQRQHTSPVPQDWLERFQPAYLIEMQHWVNALRGGPAFIGATAWDGYQAACIAEACLRSMRSGLPVTLL